MNATLQTKFGTANMDVHGYYKITSKQEGNYGKLLHRLIFEDFYKITLPSTWLLHHDDGNKTNNNIWNLVPMTKSEHTLIHNKGREYSIETKIRMSKSQNNSSGFFRVYKVNAPRCSQGFYWEYSYYDEDGKRKSLSSVSIEKLEKKVKNKNLEWIKL